MVCYFGKDFWKIRRDRKNRLHYQISKYDGGPKSLENIRSLEILEIGFHSNLRNLIYKSEETKIFEIFSEDFLEQIWWFYSVGTKFEEKRRIFTLSYCTLSLRLQKKCSKLETGPLGCSSMCKMSNIENSPCIMV